MYFWLLLLVIGVPFLQKYVGEQLKEIGMQLSWQHNSYWVSDIADQLLMSNLGVDILFSLPFWLMAMFFIARYGACDDEAAFWGIDR